MARGALRQLAASKRAAGKQQRICAMEEALPPRVRIPTRNEVLKNDAKRRLSACREAAILFAKNVFCSMAQACAHFNLSYDNHNLVGYHMKQWLEGKRGVATLDSFEQCSVPTCSNQGCPCTAESGDVDADVCADDAVADWTPEAWFYARSMFADKSLSVQNIADNVEREHGVKRHRSMFFRWRTRNQVLMPQKGAPTRLPPAAEQAIIDTVVLLRAARTQVAPMHLAMIAWQVAIQLSASTGSDFPENGFTRSWVRSFCERHKEKLGLASCEIIEDLRLHACTSKKSEQHYEIVCDALLKLGWATANPEYDPTHPFDANDATGTRCQPLFIKGSKASRIVSMDETRFTLNSAKDGKAVGGTRKTIVIKQEDSVTGAPQDWGECLRNKSDCDCSIAGGSTCAQTALPALFIFKGGFNPVTDLADGPTTRTADGETLHCRGVANEKGSMTDEVMLNWLDACLKPMFPDLSPDNHVMLICDGYGSHLNIGFLRRCAELGVLVILRPPHTSHVTQGEDAKGGHFHTFHRLERITKDKMRAARELKPHHRHDGKRDSQLKRSDIMVIVKKSWEEAFSPAVCSHSWQRIGVHPFTRRPYWELRGQEDLRERQKNSVAPMARRQLHEEAAAGLRAADVAEAFLEVPSSEDELPQKRINNSSNWWARGIITQGAALELRESMEAERAEDARSKAEARGQREAAQETKRLSAASEGATLDGQLQASTRTLAGLNKNQITCLLTHFGQKAPATTKSLIDHQGLLYQFLASRPDLSYSPSHAASLAGAALAAEPVVAAPFPNAVDN